MKQHDIREQDACKEQETKRPEGSGEGTGQGSGSGPRSSASAPELKAGWQAEPGSRDHEGNVCWREDLAASRDLSQQDQQGFGFAIGWFEDWRIRKERPPGREAANAFWRTCVRSKERKQWQLDQWEKALHWYLRWLELCQARGGDGRTLPERVRAAVKNAGARRGLARRTRDSYSSWVARFGSWAGTAERAKDPALAREWLSELVTVHQVSFSTQKQALNALAFFFRDVCGMEEVDLGVRMRKTPPRVPTVPTVKEVVAILSQLEGIYRLAAKLQYGAGLRVGELTSLRIKDIDLERCTVTVRQGKGDRDRVTIIPEALKDDLQGLLDAARALFDEDRAAGRPGVAIPGAFGRKFSRAGERWEWFWLFPSRKESRDPESGIVRRHHLHPKVYGRKVTEAAERAGVTRRLTSHGLRHGFATHLMDEGTDIRTVQDLLGHADIRTTERYVHAMKHANGKGVKSPFDRLEV